MKFGKKKTTGDVEKEANPGSDNKGSDPKDSEKKSASSRGPALKRLSGVMSLQALVILLSGIVAAALLHFLVLQPALREQTAREADEIVSQAALQVEQQLDLLSSLVSGYAGLPATLEAIGDSSERSSLQTSVGQLFPQASHVFFFPTGDVPRRSDNEAGLGFASLDLARKAESGSQPSPDAFPRNDQWYFQIAAPVREGDNGRVQGSLLVVFEAGLLRNTLAAVTTARGGKLDLVQSASGETRTVATSGSSASGMTGEQAVGNSSWKLRYTTAGTGAGLLNPLMAYAAVLVPALLASIIVWVLLSGAQRSLRQDMGALVQWANKAFAGERVRRPALRWELAGSLGEALQRLVRVVDKRLSRTAEQTKPAAPRKPASKTGAEDAEPLFQDEDMLDIDMLDGDDDVLGLGDEQGVDGFGVEETAAPATPVAPGIFRAYDIRGIVGETLTAEVVTVIGRAIGSEAISRDQQTLCIGYDGRHSSPELAEALAEGILSTGCDVIDIGAVPTPVLYFATHHLETGSGVMVTGSHNPANYNGLKMMLGGETLSGDTIQKLLQRIQTGDFARGRGSRGREDVRRAYLDRIVEDIAVAAPLKVVVDAGNGIAGELGPMLVEELGCEVIPLYCDVDGDFPNHHPDPGKPANMADLIARVKAEKADIGIAFDGDGDRLGVVTNEGRIIWPDRLLMLFARDVVSRNPGADVLYDVKCSRRLAGVISQTGGRPVMWKTGHSLMKAKMKETGALLAGEMSGHIFFKERWYGFDDGLYSAARLLEILGVEDRHSEEIFAEFPEDISTPELNVATTDEAKFALVERLSTEGQFGDANISTIDGVRVDYPDGWGLCRASNTTPVLVLRFEAETEEALARIQTIFRDQLGRLDPSLDIGF